MENISNVIRALLGDSTPLPPQKGVDPMLMREYIKRTPHLNAAYTPLKNIQELIDSKQKNTILPEAAAIADPFGITQITRWLGGNVPSQVLLNESHGLANIENFSHYPKGY